MAKKVDFKGPSLQDFDKQDNIEENKNIAEPPKSITKGRAVTPIANNRSARSPENLFTANRNAIREYLYNALGNQESAFIRLADISENLNINMNTLYRHLKVLRETDFMLKKVFNGTEIRRR
jgi:hypothetical protein